MDWRMPRAYVAAPRRIRRLDGLGSNGTAETYSPPPPPAGEAAPAKGAAVVWMPITPTQITQPPRAPGVVSYAIETAGKVLDIGTYLDPAKRVLPYAIKVTQYAEAAPATKEIARPLIQSVSSYGRALQSWVQAYPAFAKSLGVAGQVLKVGGEVLTSGPATVVGFPLTVYSLYQTKEYIRQSRRGDILAARALANLVFTRIKGSLSSERARREWEESDTPAARLEISKEDMMEQIKSLQDTIAHWQRTRRLPNPPTSVNITYEIARNRVLLEKALKDHEAIVKLSSLLTGAR